MRGRTRLRGLGLQDSNARGTITGRGEAWSPSLYGGDWGRSGHQSRLLALQFIFKTIWSFINPMLEERTRKKIHVLGAVRTWSLI